MLFRSEDLTAGHQKQENRAQKRQKKQQRKKLKNKIFNTFLTLIFLTANAGLCEQTRSAVMHNAIIKFGLAMGGVALSSIIIFAGLTLYNKFFVKQQRPHSLEEEILKTPKTTEEAIKFFINKNKLGFGAIDLLVGLVITAIVFFIGVNTFKGISSLKINETSERTQSVQEQVDQTVNEIEQMRQQTIDYNNKIQKDNF